MSMVELPFPSGYRNMVFILQIKKLCCSVVICKVIYPTADFDLRAATYQKSLNHPKWRVDLGPLFPFLDHNQEAVKMHNMCC